MSGTTCFLHVPKSGGSTVVSALRRSVNGALFHAHERAHYIVPLEYLLSRYRIVAGHFTFAQLSPAILQNTFLFTVLREPVDRAISLYYFYRGQSVASALDPRVALAQAHDLTSFASQLPDRITPWCNWQTFVFSGARDCERPARELLPSAVENLRRFTLVGISDELGAVLRRVAEIGGWPLQPPSGRVNATPQRVPLDQIDPEVLQRLARLNDCDRQLFSCARELWEQAKTAGTERAHARPARQSPPLPPTVHEHGTKEIAITGVQITARRLERASDIYVGDSISIRLSGYSRITTADITVGIRIDDHLGIEVYGVNTRLLELGLELTAGQTFDVTFTMNANLAPGIYHVTAAAHGGADHLHRCYHWIDNVAAFECRTRRALTFSGMCDLQATATVDTATARGGCAPAAPDPAFASTAAP